MIPSFEKATALRAVPLFAALTADELVALGALTEELTPNVGEEVFAEGAPGDSIYVVVRGRVRIERRGRLIAAMGPGECFGEVAALDQMPRSANVIADEESLLLRLRRDDFLDVLGLYPAVARTLLELMARRLRATEAGRT